MKNRIDQLKYYISVLQNILKEFRMNTNVETIIKSYESKIKELEKQRNSYS